MKNFLYLSYIQTQAVAHRDKWSECELVIIVLDSRVVHCVHLGLCLEYGCVPERVLHVLLEHLTCGFMVLLGAFELPLKLLGLAGKTFDYPIYFDLEEQSQLSRGRAFCDSLVKAFCEEMEKGGYFAGFYTSTFVMANILSPSIRKRFAFWCAQWAAKNTFEGLCGLWQYASNGRVPGIVGDVDMDLSYIDYPSIIRKGGFNGYGKGALENPPTQNLPEPNNEKTEVPEKTIDELAREVIQGLWGNGDERIRRLTEAGYSYQAVQDRVNEILR